MMLTNPDDIMRFHMKTQLSALRLELMGMRHSRGSVYAHIKKTYGLRGNKSSVYEQFKAMVESK
jgi:hypothetical protein